MQPETKEKIEKLKKLTIDFLSIANSIDEDEWIEFAKYVREERARLSKIRFGIELGNIILMFFYLNEILDSLPLKCS